MSYKDFVDYKVEVWEKDDLVEVNFVKLYWDYIGKCADTINKFEKISKCCDVIDFTNLNEYNLF